MDLTAFWPIFWSIIGTIGTGLATWLTAVIVNWLNQKIKDKKLAKYASDVFQIIMSAVQTVFQSFVDVLKKEGKFGPEQQEEARRRAYSIIVSQLTPELKKYIEENFGDAKEYIMNQIEAMIYNLKN